MHADTHTHSNIQSDIKQKIPPQKKNKKTALRATNENRQKPPQKYENRQKHHPKQKLNKKKQHSKKEDNFEKRYCVTVRHKENSKKQHKHKRKSTTILARQDVKAEKV